MAPAKLKYTPLQIKKITEKIIGLPTLPTVVSKMIELVDNPRTSASSLANLISADQVLTARILKIANSAYYGFPRQISTVNTAIVVMGFNAVKEMGLSLTVFDIFKDIASVRHFDVIQFWQHSIATGIAAKTIAKHFMNSISGELFVAGLLHDIGKVVISQYLHKDFMAIMTRVADTNESLVDVEKEFLGADHGEIGAWLAEKWRLPELISESIHYHHEPWNAAKNQLLVCFVYIANYLSHASHIGSSGIAMPIDQKVWNHVSENNIPFTQDNLADIQTEFLLELDRTNTLPFISAPEL